MYTTSRVAPLPSGVSSSPPRISSTFAYSISYGIAAGFITYCIVKVCRKKASEVHPIVWIVSVLFILDFVCMAILQ